MIRKVKYTIPKSKRKFFILKWIEKANKPNIN